MSVLPAGKPRLLDRPDIQDAIIAAVADGLPLGTAWRMAGYAREGLQDWAYAAQHGVWRNGRRVDPRSLEIIRSFCERLDVARAQHEASLINQIIAAGKRENAKTGLIDWRPSAWLLNNRPDFRREYHEYKEPPTTIIEALPTKPPSLRDKTDAEIIELAGGAWRELLEEETPNAHPNT